MSQVADRILVIEDDRESRLEDRLRRAGYEPLSAASAQEGMRLFYDSHPALVLLDIMLPGADGWDTCRRISEASDIPIITLSSRTSHTDILRGFELGVEDHMTKPFDPAELLSRVRALLQRRSHAEDKPTVPKRNGLEVNLRTSQVSLNGRNVGLSPTESSLLVQLMRKQNGVVAHRELPFHARGPAYVCDEEHISVYTWFLRKKPEKDSEDPKYVMTERGPGHRVTKESSKAAKARQPK